MKHFILFVKGIFVGIGGVAPGLSGSVMMISLGLYYPTIQAIATIHKNFKEKILFLLPVVSGMLGSTIFFSRVIDGLLKQYEIQTRLAFFGMLLGTVPLFFAEVKRREALRLVHVLIMVPAFMFGLLMLYLGDRSTTADAINIPISFTLGFLGIALTIIPGLNWATFFSAIGLYGHWLTLMSFRPENFTLIIYGPALVGALIGLITVSRAVSFLFGSFYTMTMSILFGFFIAVVPSIIIDSSTSLESIRPGPSLYVGLVLFCIGIAVALWFGKLSKKETKDPGPNLD